jgi:ABC-type Mn2+/Zn2+ transport system ATPase subunit
MAMIDFEKYIDSLIDISNNIKANEITILTGRNAGGKSLIRRLLRDSIETQLGKKKVFIPHASQELRTKSNPDMGALSGMAHDLEWLATSDNTIHTIKNIFRKDADYVVIDEPEIGLGEELQLGLIDFINEKTEKFGKGVLIITHSRVTALGLRHDNFINLEGLSFDEWICRNPEKISVSEFQEFATGLFKAVRDRINNNKKKK